MTDKSPRRLLSNFASGFDLLLLLYPNREVQLKQIAIEMGQDLGNLSRKVQILIDLGLMKHRHEHKGQGRPVKYVALTPLAVTLIKSVEEALK